MALIYIVEDDENIREIETVALEGAGYQVVGAGSGRELRKMLEEQTPDLLLLDVMLPDYNGNEIVLWLRKNQATRELPVIMVTAKTTERDMIRGLENGADDYIKKPFSITELITRVRVLLRRTTPQTENLLVMGDIAMDTGRHIVMVGEQPVELTYKEYELLKLFLSSPNAALSRERILEKVWDTTYEGESRTVDMHIKTLRQKLGDQGKRIRTLRNVGYIME